MITEITKQLIEWTNDLEELVRLNLTMLIQIKLGSLQQLMRLQFLFIIVWASLLSITEASKKKTTTLQR